VIQAEQMCQTFSAKSIEHLPFKSAILTSVTNTPVINIWLWESSVGFGKCGLS
jgi:hypothetical protein